MGNKLLGKPKNGNSKIGQDTSCPKCGRKFYKNQTYNTLNYHLDHCLISQDNSPQANQNPSILQQPPVVQKPKLQDIKNDEHIIWTKVPINPEKTQFRWEKKKMKEFSINTLLHKKLEEIRQASFEEKQVWFKHNLEKLRIPWNQGADWLKIHNDNILLNSLSIINNINLHKEVKIEFIGDKVQDAGGLLREWMYLITKELFHPNTGLFILTETEEVMYKINPDVDVDEHICNCYKLFGKIVGKAIFERIPLNVYLDRTLIKHILNQKVELADIQLFDKELYQSWNFILNNQLESDEILDYFVAYKRNNGKLVEIIELKPGGQEIQITNENKKEYIQLQIEYITQKQIKIFLDSILTELYKVVPKDLLSIFETHEFEMILNGLPFINVDDWQSHTTYKGEYTPSHKVILWFWNVIRSLDQDQQAKFLQYCTGSTRLPVEGFKKLERNRGEYAMFCIESTIYSKQNPFPKAHTCFNRLELPMYQSESQLDLHLKSIINNDLDGIFGME